MALQMPRLGQVLHLPSGRRSDPVQRFDFIGDSFRKLLFRNFKVILRLQVHP
jgi:hypothetical protein